MVSNKNQSGFEQLEKDKEPGFNFEDNYEFYMYHLNTSGQLITPQEQIDPLNPNSRVVLSKTKLSKISKLKADQEKDQKPSLGSQFGQALRGKLGQDEANAKKGKENKIIEEQNRRIRERVSQELVSDSEAYHSSFSHITPMDDKKFRSANLKSSEKRNSSYTKMQSSIQNSRQVVIKQKSSSQFRNGDQSERAEQNLKLPQIKQNKIQPFEIEPKRKSKNYLTIPVNKSVHILNQSQNVNKNQLGLSMVLNKDLRASVQVMPRYMSSQGPRQEEKHSLSPEEKSVKRKEKYWNIHLNDSGVRDKLLLQRKAQQYYQKEVRSHVPKINQSKQLEIEIRKMKMDVKADKMRDMKRINLADVVEKYDL
ncbi:UNKNOWN [Stylonychia lemnae]|uniref:Uncharacterized protein n=1 Tax=Stylonychia lemnae TaxID=5949 RepID=A0A078AJ88_STYLE|nr:UNKNOWN [Stylonychia lemnae]|eukprot:CDW81971.1 UNKNOWN [Stylonychia lemnae]